MQRNTELDLLQVLLLLITALNKFLLWKLTSLITSYLYYRHVDKDYLIYDV
jgi:hypothetical protein